MAWCSTRTRCRPWTSTVWRGWRRRVELPIAIGEAYPNLFALRPLIERGIIDIAQPDTGRFGGLWQMKKLAAIAEAHQVMVAPHQGSLGPVAEMAAIHLLATLPNYLNSRVPGERRPAALRGHDRTAGDRGRPHPGA